MLKHDYHTIEEFKEIEEKVEQLANGKHGKRFEVMHGGRWQRKKHKTIVKIRPKESIESHMQFFGKFDKLRKNGWKIDGIARNKETWELTLLKNFKNDL